ncbi:MAG TPA: hypothetical protein DCE44_23275 [Verrucomicrobiales bacterium]|nr:hypothetical protein [Verrucomicrobiales bacterium]
MVNKGIRGSLEIESFLTGMLYVGLDVYTNAPPPDLRTPPGKYPEIPTVQSGLQKLAGSLPKVERILDRIEAAATELNDMLKQIQVGQINKSLLDALGDVQTLLRSPSLTNAFVSVEKMADEFRVTASDLRGDLKPLINQFSNTAVAADQTIAELERTLVDARRLVGDDSPMVSQLVATLAEFQRTAVSLRQLADFLSRNPQSILTGRDRSNDSHP